MVDSNVNIPVKQLSFHLSGRLSRDYKRSRWFIYTDRQGGYYKSTIFGVLLYLANLANCVFSLIFVAAKIYVDRTLHRRAAGGRQI